MIVTSLPNGASLAPRILAVVARRTWSRAALQAAALLLVGPWLAGCGYEQAQPGLPAGAQSLAIGVIRNHTFRGELDVLLRDALRQRLQRAPRVRLTAPERGDLLLVVELLNFQVTRVRNLTDSSISSVTFALSGRMALFDQREQLRNLTSGPVAASATLNFASPVIETPAVLDEGLEAAIEAFAAEVEARLFRFF